MATLWRWLLALGKYTLLANAMFYGMPGSYPVILEDEEFRQLLKK
jgi:hypothetical protein